MQPAVVGCARSLDALDLVAQAEFDELDAVGVGAAQRAGQLRRGRRRCACGPCPSRVRRARRCRRRRSATEQSGRPDGVLAGRSRPRRAPSRRARRRLHRQGRPRCRAGTRARPAGGRGGRRRRARPPTSCARRPSGCARLDHARDPARRAHRSGCGRPGDEDPAGYDALRGRPRQWQSAAERRTVPGRSGHGVTGGARPHTPGQARRADRGRRQPGGPLGVHRWVPARRGVHPAAPVRTGQDGRRHHPGARRVAHRPGQRPPHAEIDHPHVRDGHARIARPSGSPAPSTCR